MKSTERQAGQEQEGALVRIESTQQPKAEQLKSLGEKLRDALSSIKSKYSLYKESETAMVELRATNKIYEKVKDLSQLNRKATQFDQKAMSYAQLRVKEIDPKSKTANRVKIELSGIEGAISEIDSIEFT